MSKQKGYKYNIVLYHDRVVVGHRIGEFPEEIYQDVQSLITQAEKHAKDNGYEFNGSEPFKDDDDEPRQLSDDGPGAYVAQDEDDYPKPQAKLPTSYEEESEPVSAIAE